MITLNEYKQYLNIVETENDGILQGFISTANSQLDSLCNRKLLKSDYTEIVECNYFKNMIYLKNYPINSISSVKYYDGVNYMDIANNYFENSESYLTANNIFSLYGKRLQVVYNGGYKFQSGTGRVKILTGSVNVLGLFDTVFSSEVTAGDYLCFDGLRKKVLTVTDDTHIILDSPVSEDHISIGYTITNVPEDLRQACKELATKLYYDSGIGNSTLLKSGESLSGTTSGSSVQFKELDMKNIIANYRNINV